MAINYPNLDDRTFKDIVEQARSLITRYCPEWTDHNESDPGITLIQLFAWMTEMIIYRLNRVPERNYLAFLELLGLARKSPEPSKTLLSFTTKEKRTGFIPKGTEVASTVAVNGERILFRTDDDVHVFPVNLAQVVGLSFDPVRGDFHRVDYTPSLTGNKNEAVPLFQGHDRLERYLYLGSPMLPSVRKGIAVKIEFGIGSEEDCWFFNDIVWEYWNGQEWKRAHYSSVYEPQPQPRVTVMLDDISECKEKMLNVGGDTLKESFIRGLIAPHYFKQDLRIASIKSFVETTSKECALDTLYAYVSETGTYSPIDPLQIFTPFTTRPQERNIFYCASRMLGLVKGLKVSFNFQGTGDAPAVSPDLELAWEYWNGTQWAAIGTSLPTTNGSGEFDFEDTTRAFTQTGAVSFVLPHDSASLAIENEENFWIRVRIAKGNYGIQGHFEERDKKREWVELPIRPPYLCHIAMRVEERNRRPFPLNHITLFDNFFFKDSTESLTKGEGAVLFERDSDRYPAFYLGFDQTFVQEKKEIPEMVQLYITMEEGESGSSEKLSSSSQDDDPASVNIAWEYWNGKTWEALQVEVDETSNFQLSGLIRFQAPRNFMPRSLFQSQKADQATYYWIRIRWISGSFERPPVIKDIRLNTVWTTNVSTMEEEWSSNGQSHLSLYTKKRPIYVETREEVVKGRLMDRPLNFHLSVSEPDCPTGNSEWEMVESFLHSRNNDSHFILDIETGKICFGDGRKGRIPLAGQKIKAAYEWCHGKSGNVPAHTVIQLAQPISGIEVTNWEPSMGGSDQESLEELKIRGSKVLKHHYRAVTKEDYETLAMEASRNVHRAKCVPAAQAGTVELIIIPKEVASSEEIGKVYPTETLVRKVHQYIDRKRLLTATCHVKGPHHVGFGVLVIVKMKAGYTKKEVQPDIEKFLKGYFDPLKGGEDGKGWPLGRDIFVYEVAHQVRRSAKVNYVTDVAMYDSDRHRIPKETGKLILDRNQLPYLYEVKVEEYTAEE